MAQETSYHLATEEDFEAFAKMCDTEEGWNVCYTSDAVKVWDQKSDKSAINIVKIYAVFPDIEADVLYDVLHDPDYRAVWDEYMIEGFNIEQLNSTNDIGYYSAKSPTPLSNRDFLNQRMWNVAADGKQLIIMNHSVVHPKCPEKKRIC